MDIQEWPRYMSMLGIFLDLIGAGFMTLGAWVGKEEAIRLGVARVGSADPEEKLKLTGVRERLHQAKLARASWVFLSFGFAMQFFGALFS